MSHSFHIGDKVILDNDITTQPKIWTIQKQLEDDHYRIQEHKYYDLEQMHNVPHEKLEHKTVHRKVLLMYREQRRVKEDKKIAIDRKTEVQSSKEIDDLFIKAQQHYLEKKMQSGDQAATEWLMKKRPIITEPYHNKIYVYDNTKGHYVKAGEALLKSDLVKAFKTQMTRTRIAEIITKISALSYREEEELEKTTPPNLLPLQNGIYDTNTQTLLPHHPKYFFTYIHQTTYDPKASCENIQTFLKEIVDEETYELLIDIATLCFYRERLTRHFFILVGQGSNGKSKYLTLVRTMLGEKQCVSVTPHSLALRPFTPVLLHNKHANLGADIPGGFIKDISIIKSVTGGDCITVERKGKDHFDIQPYCELIYSCNDPPRFSEDNAAIWDRIVVVKFPYAFIDKNSIKTESDREKDPDIEKKILTTEEISGFFNIIMKRLTTLIQNKKLTVDITPEQTKDEYSSVTNTPIVFLEKMCEEVQYMPGDNFLVATGWIEKRKLYKAYQQFCVEKKLKVESSKTFSIRIMDALGWFIEDGKETSRGQRVHSYRNISLGKSRVSGMDGFISYSTSNYVKPTPPQNRAESRTTWTPKQESYRRDLKGIKELRQFFKMHSELIPIKELQKITEKEFQPELQNALKMLETTGDIYQHQPGIYQRS